MTSSRYSADHRYRVFSSRHSQIVRIHITGCPTLQRAIGLSDQAGRFDGAEDYAAALALAKERKIHVGARVIQHCKRCGSNHTPMASTEP